MELFSIVLKRPRKLSYLHFLISFLSLFSPASCNGRPKIRTEILYEMIYRFGSIPTEMGKTINRKKAALDQQKDLEPHNGCSA